MITKRGFSLDALAGLVMRPQAETQIGAAHQGLESARLRIKG